MFERFLKKASSGAAEPTWPRNLSNPEDVLNELVADPLVGTVLADRYRIIAEIGEGGMGRVYRAEQIVLGGQLAIKVLNETYGRRGEIRKRFLKEAQAASQLNHENVVKIFDFGETPQGSVFFAMELLEGRDLGEFMQAQGRVGWPEAKLIVAQICRALIEAHDRGIVHRDIKPGNCFLEQRSDGSLHVKLLDFGIAKTLESDDSTLTEVGTVLGTASYMAPEQAKGIEVDTRADIYAVGVILFQLLTGRVPFTGENVMSVIFQVTTQPVPRPSQTAPDANITRAMEAVIMRALEKEPARRFSSMKALLAALSKVDSSGARRSLRSRRASSEQAPVPEPVARTLGQLNRAKGPSTQPTLERSATTPPPPPPPESGARPRPKSTPPPAPDPAASVAKRRERGWLRAPKLWLTVAALVVAGWFSSEKGSWPAAFSDNLLLDGLRPSSLSADLSPAAIEPPLGSADEPEVSKAGKKPKRKSARRSRKPERRASPDTAEPAESSQTEDAPDTAKQPVRALTRDASQKVIDEQIVGLRGQFQNCARKSAAVRGTKVGVVFSIARTGAVGSARAQGRHAKTKLGRCIAAAVRKTEFPAGTHRGPYSESIDL